MVSVYPEIPPATEFIDEPRISLPLEDYLKPPNLAAEHANRPLPSKSDYKHHNYFFRTGFVQNVKTSCYMEHGKTQLLALVIPPEDPLTRPFTEPEPEEENEFEVLVKYAIFATRVKDDIPNKENALSCFLRKSLEPILCMRNAADQGFQIRIVVINDDGCVFSAAVNACLIACINGGVALFESAASSTVALYNDVLYTNPDTVIEELIANISDDDAKQEYGIMCTVTMLPEIQLTGFDIKGALSQSTIEKLRKRSAILNRFMLKMLSRHATKHLCRLANISESEVPTEASKKALKRKFSTSNL